MDAATRRIVRARAGDRCEYCRLLQSAAAAFRFHVEHVRPRQHGGSDDADNLALACNRCNLHKGPNLTGVDPQGGAVTLLFDPRRDVWDDHFTLAGGRVVGRTPTGRATVELFRMNVPARV